MNAESVIWFTGQLLAAAAAGGLGYVLAKRPGRVWKSAACLAAAVMLLWPTMRLFPAGVLNLLGAPTVMHMEVTGIIVPAFLLFSIAARHVPKRSEQRAVGAILVICGLYLFLFGNWMLRSPLDDLGSTRFEGGVCLQSTSYTCVAASLVTLLQAHGIEASETEMARLTQTQRNFGATDSRAIRSLQRKLGRGPLDIHYEDMDYPRLCEVPMPCVVPIDWGYFVSHMVPVLSADAHAVVLGDPLTGTRVCSARAFQQMWRKRGIYLGAPRWSLAQAGHSNANDRARP